MFFWVFPRRQIVVDRRFGTLYQFHIQRLCVEYTLQPAFEDGTDTGFRNVGQLQFDAGEIPKRTYTILKSRRKFEIKNNFVLSSDHQSHFLVSEASGLIVSPFFLIFILSSFVPSVLPEH